MGTKEGPSIPCSTASVTRPPTFQPMPGSEKSIPRHWYPQAWIVSVSAEGTQNHHLGLLALATATHKMKGCPQTLPEPCGPSCTPCPNPLPLSSAT